MLSKFLAKRKILLSFLTVLILFSLAVKPLLAFSGPTIRGGYYFNFENAVYKMPEEMNLQSFVNETLKATVSSIITSVVGCFSCTAEEREQFPGFIFAAAHLIAGIYTSPPASGVQYLADIGRQLEIVKPAHAQEEGIGFTAMEKVRDIWKAFRNISYVFFVLILVFIGFAIMFRVKINPQTVISLQSALPKIVIALILITFSYAIVGFMIDLMYVFLGLISTIFIGPSGLVEQTLGLGDELNTIRGFVETLLGDSPASAVLVTDGIFFVMAGFIAFAASLIAGPINFLMAIIGIILLLVALVRCLWTLLKAYTMVIVSLIFAPLQILVGTLPGSNAIGSWFRNLLGNLAVLPAMFVMFFIGTYLILSGMMEVFDEVGPLLSGWITGGAISHLLIVAQEGLWNFFAVMVLPLIGLMVLFMAPKVSDMIKTFLAGKPFEYGTAIGEAFGPMRTVAGVGIAGGIGYGAEELTSKARVQAKPWLEGLIKEGATAAQKRVLSK